MYILPRGIQGPFSSIAQVEQCNCSFSLVSLRHEARAKEAENSLGLLLNHRRVKGRLQAN